MRSARVYLLEGTLTDEQVAEIKKYVINPVEAREASLDTKQTLKMEYPVPAPVKVLEGFNQLDEEQLKKFIADNGLAMDLGDIEFCQKYFRSEHRDPTITEIKMIDTYWSDHCRHTTFGTILDHVTFEDALLQKTYEDYLTTRNALGRSEKPICLMDLATIAVKHLKAAGKLPKLDESEEINACTVKMDVTVDGVTEPWLLLFKNETHNHPTEIEPFGGAATCIGGAIRDPLSGRSYVYGAMRVTGAADPMWTAIGLALGTYLNWKLVARRLRRYSVVAGDAITIPDFFAKRFHDKKGVVSTIAAVIILVFFSVYVGSCFVTVGKLFATLFGFDYHVMMIIGAVVVFVYTVVGGYLSVVMTDFIQGMLMFFALAVVFIGTVASAWSAPSTE